MENYRLLSFFVLLLFFCSCRKTAKRNTGENNSKFELKIKNLTDKEYPDNPDIGFRSEVYQSELFSLGELDIVEKEKSLADFYFYTKTNDTISLEKIDLSEFFPTIPDAIKDDEYLSYISCVNQEWNRNQVRFLNDEFNSTDKKIKRVDLARNCLNAYLWEVILYIEENGSLTPYAHGWFDFPHDLYAQFFEQKNNIPFSKYDTSLVNWVEPENRPVDLNKLRKRVKPVKINYADKSESMYPLKAAREKKFKEIIYPITFETMKDLQTDSTLFATFTPPGFYNKKDPRKTELGRFYNLENAEVNEIESEINGAKLKEVKLDFKHKSKNIETSLIVGGLNFDDFPILNMDDANKGWKNSMGIGNHTFYETYAEHNSIKAATNPYYGLLMDENGNWLDSHKVGIDGPIFHFSDENKKVLHLWLLSFERHALVGHYVMELK